MARKQQDISILLMEDIESLGKAGEIAKVRAGYARNYLFPKGLASLPDANALAAVEARKRRAVEEAKKREARLQELAEKIPQTNVTLEMKVSDDGKLYGAVTPQMVAKAMADAGLDVPASHVRMEHTIKEIGQFEIPIHVHGELIVNARIWVVRAPD